MVKEKKKQVTCPWCGETSPDEDVIISRKKGDNDSIIERKCPKCQKVLAAYRDNEGDFLPRIRRF